MTDTMVRAKRSTVCGVLAGLAGTAAMTITTSAETRLRRDEPDVVDYDASEHVVTAAAAVSGLSPRTHRQRTALFLLVHWGYGSCVGVAYEALGAVVPRRAPRTLLFFVLCQGMAWTLFPLAGDTPPPWRWRPSVFLSGLAQHAVYALTVAVAAEALRE